MARYIDSDALIENIKRVYCTDCNNYNEVRCRACGTDDAMAMIEDAPTADVAPRAEVAREILADIRDKGGFNDPFVEYICLSYDELIALERKYTKADPLKAKQPKDLENFEKKRLLAGDCFNGEIWYRCPYCLTGIEAHSIPKDRICHNCGKEYL